MTTNAPAPRSITMLLGDILDELALHQRPTTESAVETDHPALSDTEATLNDGTPRAETSTLGALLDALDERAFGLMLLLLALPCCLPFLYGIPQIVALPMLALAAQLAAGRHDPWLPSALRNRSFEISAMRSVVDRAKRYLGWVERLAHPRLTFLTEGIAVRIIGALLLIPCASILVPLPSTNTAPGIGVAIAAVGLIERDGLLVLLGLIAGLVWVALLVFFGAEVISAAKDFVLTRF